LFCFNQEAQLNVRNLENFQEALVCQYRDLIHEAILESETDHKTRLNLGKLNSKLKVIYKAAQYDGLPENTINELIDEAVPTTREKAA
jgi:hypothetical protein